jgi:23S rRNA (adenine2030-N6)-methyltransferase
MALTGAWRKWREGVFIAWYPVKDARGPRLLAQRVSEAGIRALRLEFFVAPPRPGQRLSASGLVVINPPFCLEAEAACLLPVLARQLSNGDGHAALGWIEPRNDGFEG